MEPSQEYVSLYEPILDKVEISRIVIQFLLDKYWENPVYAELVKHIKSLEKYTNPENLLMHHVKFICQRVSFALAIRFSWKSTCGSNTVDRSPFRGKGYYQDV